MTPSELRESRLAKKKLDKKWTQAYCADLAAVNIRTYQGWESGRSPMPKPERFWFLDLPAILRRQAS